jgi:hypothetical protein
MRFGWILCRLLVPLRKRTERMKIASPSCSGSSGQAISFQCERIPFLLSDDRSILHHRMCGERDLNRVIYGS